MSALTVYNGTNDTLTIRYMTKTHVGTAELKLGPRDSRLIQDAYDGMTLYASNAFDPSSVYAQLQVNAQVDSVHFTEQGGGYGKPPPPGPPERVSAPSRAQRKPRSTPKTEVCVPAAASPDDAHGVSLSVAHSSDLTQQQAQEQGGEQQQAEQRLYVPGLGYVGDIPEHIRQQIEERKARQDAANVREGPNFPDYDEQQRAMACDGKPPLLPIVVHRPRRTGLTLPERWVAWLLQVLFRCSETNSHTYARPVSLLLLALAVYYGVCWMRKRRRERKLHSRGTH